MKEKELKRVLAHVDKHFYAKDVVDDILDDFIFKFSNRSYTGDLMAGVAISIKKYLKGMKPLDVDKMFKKEVKNER